jgi:hypothetical protein
MTEAVYLAEKCELSSGLLDQHLIRLRRRVNGCGDEQANGCHDDPHHRKSIRERSGRCVRHTAS